MVKLRIKITIWLVIIFYACAYSQDKDSFETKYVMGEGEVALQEEAEWLLSYGKYEKALECFLKLDKRYPFNEVYKYYSGICYLEKYDQQEKAIEYLEQAYQKNSTLESIHFYLAKAYFLNYRFDEALGNLKLAEKSKTTSNTHKNKINTLMASCEAGKQMVRGAKAGQFNIINLGDQVNSEGDEYLPLIPAGNENVLLFTYRGKKSRGGLQNIYGEPDPDGNYTDDIYAANYSENNWLPPRGLGGKVNTNLSEIATTVSLNGEQLFINKDDNGGDIYLALKSKNSWLAPVKLTGEINTKNFEGHATISPDGKVLYFTSDRPGGFGGMDIYKATLSPDNDWGNIENLGPLINTEENEDAPFIHASGSKLYFSSKGHNTMGGYDIFHSNFTDGDWDVPVNLGYPVNTTNDDRFYSVTPDGKSGFLSSERKGGNGGEDIYLVRPGMPDQEPVFAMITGKTTLNGKPKSAIITVTNIQTGKIQGVYTSSSATGNYVISLPGMPEYELDFVIKGNSLHREIINLGDLMDFVKLNQDFELSAKRNPDLNATDVLQLQLDELVQLALINTNQTTDEIDTLKENADPKDNESVTGKNWEGKDIVQPQNIALELSGDRNTALHNTYAQNRSVIEPFNWETNLIEEDEISKAESLVLESVLLFEQGQAKSIAARIIGDISIQQNELTNANTILTRAIIKQEEGSNKFQYILNHALFIQECRIGPGIKDIELEEIKKLQAKAIALYDQGQQLRAATQDTSNEFYKRIFQASQLEKLAIEKLTHSINQCKFHKNEATLAMLATDNSFHDRLSLDSLIQLQDHFNKYQDSLTGLWENAEFIKDDSTRLNAYKKGNGIGYRLIENQEKAIAIYRGVDWEAEETEEQTPVKEPGITEPETTISRKNEEAFIDSSAGSGLEDSIPKEILSADTILVDPDTMKMAKTDAIPADTVITEHPVLMLDTINEPYVEVSVPADTTAIVIIAEEVTLEIPILDTVIEPETDPEPLATEKEVVQIPVIEKTEDLPEENTVTINKDTTIVIADPVERPTIPVKEKIPDFVFANILFDFNKYELRDLSKKELDRVFNYLAKNDLAKMEIAGHADAIGPEAYNMSLSEKRARKAGNYLVKKGLVKQRLKLYAYGESSPDVPNTFPDGRDNPSNRQKNRRVSFSGKNEFTQDNSGKLISLKPVKTSKSGTNKQSIAYKVQIAAYRHPKNFDHTKTDDLGTPDILNIEGITRFTIGTFSTLQEARKLKSLVVKKGVSDAFITAEINSQRKYLTELSDMKVK